MKTSKQVVGTKSVADPKTVSPFMCKHAAKIFELHRVLLEQLRIAITATNYWEQSCDPEPEAFHSLRVALEAVSGQIGDCISDDIELLEAAKDGKVTWFEADEVIARERHVA